jgi:hypothetical protein
MATETPDDTPKRSAVEGIKETSRWLRGTLADELAQDVDHFTDAPEPAEVPRVVSAGRSRRERIAPMWRRQALHVHGPPVARRKMTGKQWLALMKSPSDTPTARCADDSAEHPVPRHLEGNLRQASMR